MKCVCCGNELWGGWLCTKGCEYEVNLDARPDGSVYCKTHEKLTGTKIPGGLKALAKREMCRRIEEE